MKSFAIILMFSLLLGCSKRAAPPERTTIGNGGNESANAFLNQADSVLNQIESSYEASRYAQENGISISTLRKLLGNNRTAVSLVPSEQAGVRNGRLYLDETTWNAKYEWGLAPRTDVLKELFKLIDLEGSDAKIAKIIRLLPAMELSQAGDFTGKVQLRGTSCTARHLHVSMQPMTRAIDLVWDFNAPRSASFRGNVSTALNLGGDIQECVIRVPVDNDWEAANIELSLHTFSKQHAEVKTTITVSTPGEYDRIYQNQTETAPADMTLLVKPLSHFHEASGVRKAQSEVSPHYIELSISTHIISAGPARVTPERMTIYPSN